MPANCTVRRSLGTVTAAQIRPCHASRFELRLTKRYSDLEQDAHRTRAAPGIDRGSIDCGGTSRAGDAYRRHSCETVLRL